VVNTGAQALYEAGGWKLQIGFRTFCHFMLPGAYCSFGDSVSI
jgi:hypothetical protein